MLRAVFIQLWNRKRSNISVAIELLCVFCLVWYMVDYLFMYAYNCSLPNHRDIRHTWKVNVGMFPAGHPNYQAAENEDEALLTHFNRLLQALHNYPGVEAVTVCTDSSTPETGFYNGSSFASVADTSTYVQGQQFSSVVSEDFFRVFGYTRDNGRIAVSMHDFDWTDPRAIVISRSMEQALFPGGRAVGQELMAYRKPDERYVVVGVVDDIKRFDYRRPQHAYYLCLHLASPSPKISMEMFFRYGGVTVAVRSKASIPDNLFHEAFKKEMTDALRIGNFYLKSVVSFSKIKEDTTAEFGVANDIRVRLYLMAFFLLNILLCVMGTFWYRITLRRGEVGLRKALGSSSRSIRNLFLAEGLILLVVATVAAMIVDLQFVKAGLIDTLGKDRNDPTIYLPDRTALRFLLTHALTACTLGVVILAAIWLPARKAASVPPVDALRDE